MDSLYKQQLCNQLDSLTALERSGYGVVHYKKPYTFPTWIVWAGGFIAVLAIVIGFNLWLDSGCGLSGVITEYGKACVN